jgi:hypothetical protein
MSPHIVTSGFGLHTYFKDASNTLRNQRKTPARALYKFNLIKLDVFFLVEVYSFPDNVLYSEMSLFKKLIFL